MTVAVITIDGPAASGKGTIAVGLAQRLKFHYLDSGRLYRLLGFYALQQGMTLSDEAALAQIAQHLPAQFIEGQVWLDGKEVSAALHTESVGTAASQIAAWPQVRAALLAVQRGFRVPPGLVTDGRDMGSVVFPDAKLKVFLTASVHERAFRRYKQLIDKGESASLQHIEMSILERDCRDSQRSIAPLQHTADTRLLDTTHLSIDEVVEQVLQWL